MKTLFLLLFAPFLLGNNESLPSEACQGQTQNNLRQGVWKCFYPTGTLLQEGPYVEGKREGYWKLYHDNGVLAGEGNYHLDVEQGYWKFYDDNGKLIIEQNY